MEITQIIISGLIGIFIGYFSSYVYEKGKNKALREDIAELTEEKEKIVANYRLEHERRTHQYEQKSKVYAHYHNLLDRYESESNPFLNEKRMEGILSTMLNAIYSNPNDQGKQMEAINVFAGEINQMVHEAFIGLKEVAHQTNELKLVAPVDIVKLVERVHSNFKSINEISNKIFDDPEKLRNGIESLSELKQSIKSLHIETIQSKSEIIRLMRLDLDSI